jgi:hypothetical protein
MPYVNALPFVHGFELLLGEDISIFNELDLPGVYGDDGA